MDFGVTASCKTSLSGADEKPAIDEPLRREVFLSPTTERISGDVTQITKARMFQNDFAALMVTLRCSSQITHCSKRKVMRLLSDLFLARSQQNFA